MKVYRNLIVGKIMEYADFFVMLLDDIGKNGGSFEIDEYTYLELYNNYIVPSDDEKAIVWLSLDSMVLNGLFVHNDKRNNTIILQSFLIDVLRFVDVKRSRELSNSDFRGLRITMEDLCDQIINSDGVEDEAYKEAMVSLNELVSKTISMIRQNVQTLDTHKNNVGELVNGLEEGVSSALSPNEIYERIIHLFDRFVVPFQEFMNPDKKLKGKRNFWQCLNKIIRHHVDIGRQDIATSLGYRKVSMSSYYKDTKRIVDDFQTYYQFMKKDKETYLAIQSAFAELQSDIQLLRHGKQVNKYLPDNAGIMKYADNIKGISNLRAGQGQKLSWDSELTPQQYEEWKRVVSEGKEEATSNNLVPVELAENPDRIRKKFVANKIFRKKFPESIDDVHVYLHNWLSAELEDYSLVDSLIAFEVFRALRKADVIKKKVFNRIEDNVYFMSYLVRSI